MLRTVEGNEDLIISRIEQDMSQMTRQQLIGWIIDSMSSNELLEYYNNIIDEDDLI